MAHAVRHPVDTLRAVGGALEVDCVPTGADNLTWVLRDRSTGAVAVVDGPESGPVLAWLDARRRRPSALWLTHVHGDHTGVVDGLVRRWPDVTVVGRAIPSVTRQVHDGARLWLGDLQVKVLLTHGHVDDHVCYQLGDVLVSGDTLFSGGCGRAFGGPMSTLHASLRRLAALPADTFVLCGHEYTLDNLEFAVHVEPDNADLAARLERVRRVRGEGGLAALTTIGDERATNPFLRVDSPTIHQRLEDHGADFQPHDGDSVFAALRRLKDRSPHRQ